MAASALIETPVRTQPTFSQRLAQSGLTLQRQPVETLQVNLGKRCNQACTHCHVEAGPNRTEMMSRRDIERLVTLLQTSPAIQTLDITGGAPELHPDFRYLVESARRLGRDVIDRCNLTVLLEPGQEDMAEFLRQHRVRVVASMPCYTEDNVDGQRGKGVFERSIEALKLLNALGYGDTNGGLVLDLVYNPGGAFLPGAQDALERDYRERLGREHGVRFSHLLTIANMPIARFRHQLERDAKLEAYLALLVANFNPVAAQAVMCKSLVSVSWDGRLYDCDFNQMLEIPAGGRSRTIWELDSLKEFTDEAIACEDHCYGCTAGAGSSCGGALSD